MEIHERLMKLPTTGVNVLAALAGNRNKEPQIIRELVEGYNREISNNVPDLKTLETLRMILCYEYQSLLHPCNGNEPLKCQGLLHTDLRTFFIKNNEYQKTEEFSVLYDIAVLQLVRSTKPFLKKTFADFWATEGFFSSTENLNLAMRVAECFADSYNLHTYLYESQDSPAELEEESSLILTIIKLWMKQKEGLQWKLLASLLPKLIITFGPHKIISPLWQHVLGSLKILPPFTGRVFREKTDLEEKLATLCVMADVCFPLEIKQVKEFHYEQCLQDEFWCILNQGLISKDLQTRKQALYLMKRALEFVEIHDSEIKKRLMRMQNSAIPFVCTKSEAEASSLEEAKKNFFLILEVLEEKQKHLVMPTLSYLPSLVKVHPDCFNPIWLRCIYRRIVQHDNESIKIFGLQEILKSEPHIFFDDDFLLFFVDALNNTFLYEYNNNKEKPKIVEDLEEIFLRWEQEEITLINSFVQTLSSVSWCPVAINWVLRALMWVTEQCEIVTNVWGNVELQCVEELIHKSLMMHNVELRISSQVLLVSAFIAYTSMPASPLNLESIFNIVRAFPDNEYLEPDTEEWTNIANHLSKIIHPSDAVHYVIRRCENILTQNLELFASTISLLVESDLIFIAKSCPAETALRSLLNNLIGADVRPYADEAVIRKVMEFAGHLMYPHSTEDRDEIESKVKIDILMTPYIDAMFKIVCKSLERKTICRYDDYVFVITALLAYPLHEEVLSVGGEELYRIKKKCINVITNPHDYCKTQWSYAVAVLLICCRNKEIGDEWEFGITFMIPLLRYFRRGLIGNEQGHIVRQWEGKFASDCPEVIARLLRLFFTRKFDNLWLLDVDWLENLQALVQTENEDVIETVADILQCIVDNNEMVARHDIDTMYSIIQLSSRIILHSKKATKTYGCVREIIRLVTNKKFLKLEGSEKYTFEFIDLIMREGEQRSLLMLELPINLLKQFTIRLQKIFISCLLHGTVPRRDQRVEQAAISHDQLSKDRSATGDDTRTNVAIREKATCNLLALGCEPEVQEIILNNLLEILEKNKYKRYFDNSHLHRLKQRVMQTLLVQEPMLNEPQRQRLHDALCDLMIAESNQRSVRLMHEWLLIRLHLKNANMRETMWKLLSMAADERPGSIVSLASVVFHTARLLSEEAQRDYIGNAILRLLPNCMGQQFNVRLYSQAILVKIYEMLPRDSTEAKTYKGIFKSVEESLSRGNLRKNFTKVLVDDFYFTIFDPVLDYNLQTIYRDLPRLANVSTDELMPKAFGTILGADWEKDIFSEFTKSRDALEMANPSVQSSKPTGELEDLSTDGGLSDIQKKIIPWKTMVPFYNDLSNDSKAKLLQRKTQNEEAGIIVVASLIDRPPNLGGIARTCEIFGAKELVIGSLRYAEDREFQTLSVSAEKWITIKEVKPHLLQYYLLQKQCEGWKLIGAEQTANSTNLLEMTFPKKTVLLLGNEKDGIPANLIPLLDTCVEIPQVGVVRSLNVHVTGAICIWQYAKQHVLM